MGKTYVRKRQDNHKNSYTCNICGYEDFNKLSFKWHKMSKKWLANIQSKGNFNYLGSFKTEIQAAQAYNNKAKELFGQFAKLNIV